ncbi:MAG: glycosyltransferase family 2 protein [Bacteroidales bacterium]|nr:glycosyltransferase family 2 protein [Bacteroidales bacterium]
MNRTRPRLGVVIVNYLNYSDTINYINNSILLQEDIDPEIVIVDNASPNDSFRLLEESFRGRTGINVLKSSENGGYAAGNNIGIRFLENKECDFILISNGDIFLDDKYLLIKMIQKYNKFEKVAFVSPVMVVNDHARSEFSAWKLPSKLKDILSSTFLLRILGSTYLARYYYKIETGNDISLKVDCVGGSFFLGAVDIFRKINYFDENTFLYYEETILGLKVRNNSLNNYLIQDLKYSHLQAHTINAIFSPAKKYRMLLNSKLYYWKTYFGAGKIFLITMKFLYIILVAEQCCISVVKKFQQKDHK